MKRLTATILLAAALAMAQVPQIPNTTLAKDTRVEINNALVYLDTNKVGLASANALTGSYDFSGATWRLPEATFAIPPSAPTTGQAWLFTDASGPGLCGGGGSSLAQCRWSGAAWQSIGGGSGGSGAAMVFGGTWASGSAYAANAVVIYSNRVYVATQASTAQEPDTAPTYWTIIGIRGALTWGQLESGI